MLRSPALLLFAILATFTTASPYATAQDLAGKKVVVTENESNIEASGVKTGRVMLGEILGIDKVNGDWLWVGSLSGYIRRSHVVPIDQAIEHFTKKIQAKGEPGDYMARAIIHQHFGDTNQALLDNAEALKKNQKLEWIVYRGKLFHDLQQHDKAIEVCNGALKKLQSLDKNAKLFDYDLSGRGTASPVAAVALILNNRGRSWVASGELQKGLADYNQAINVEPKYWRAIANRALAWEEKGELEQAIADFNQVLQQYPKNVGVLNNRARVHLKRKDLVKATADADAALAIDPKNSGAVVNRRIIRELKGEWDILKKELESDVTNNGNAETENVLAWFLATCPSDPHRDGNRALEIATQCVKETERKDGRFLDTLAAALAEVGKFDDAVAVEAEALTLATPDSRAEFESRKALYTSQKPFRAERKWDK